jgi:hypothetical protein
MRLRRIFLILAATSALQVMGRSGKPDSELLFVFLQHGPARTIKKKKKKTTEKRKERNERVFMVQ